MALTQMAARPRAKRSSTFLAAVSALSLLLLAACGSASTVAGGTPASPAASVAAKPTGTPIKTVTISAVNWNGPTYENIQVTAKLFESWINDHGGINGHPLQVITCDDKGDPAQTSACARKAIEGGAVADVGSFSYNAGIAVPIYQKANTAIFGGCCNLAPVEYQSANTFQMGNSPSLNPGGVAKAVQDGCKNIGVLELDLGGITDSMNVLFKNVAAAGGYKGSLKLVKVPLTTQDYTSQVAQVTDGTDCISMFLSESNISGLMPAFATTGGKQRLYGAQGNFDKQSTKGFENLPGVQNGVVYGAYPTLLSPVWKDLRASIKQYNAPDKFEYNSLATLGAWAAYTGFAQIASKIQGDVTPQSFLAAASKATVDTGGMTPVFDFSKTWDAFNGQYARSFSSKVTYFKLSDNSQIGDSVYVDLTNALQGKPN